MSTRNFWVIGVVILLVSTGCGTTIETTLNKDWEQERAYAKEENRMFTQMHITDEGDAVTLISPDGVQTINENGEVLVERDRAELFIDSDFSTDSEKAKSFINDINNLQTDKVTFLYVPHRHSILEFDYATSSETVSLINLNNRNVEWIVGDLSWSLERYQNFVNAIAGKALNFGGQVATDAASEVLLPQRFVGNLTQIIPELDAILFKTLDGLSLISLEDGTVKWTNESFRGGLAEIIYDEASNSLVAINSDDEAFSVEGLQFNKQMMRIDAESGSTVWTGSYDGNIREKLDGFGIWADRKTDIRLAEGKIMINFLNVEVYDFETGDQLWQTSTGNDRLLDLVAPEAQIMNTFAFPVIHENMLFRVNHENVGLSGVDVVIQAFDYQSGDLLWKTNKLSRSRAVNDMLVSGDNLVVSLDRSEKVLAVNMQNGEIVWENTGFGKNGVQYEMSFLDGNIIAAGINTVRLLNANTGEEVFKIDPSTDGLGDLTDLVFNNDQIYLAGENGMGVYDPGNGSVSSSVSLPTGGLLNFSDVNDRILIIPKPAYADASYPVGGAFHLINGSNSALLGTLGTDDNRRDWLISPDYSNIYVLKDETVSAYSAN